MKLRTKHLECACSTPEHSIKVCYYPNDAEDLCIYVQMNPLPLFKRIKLAIKYIFNKTNYSHWQETLLEVDDVVSLRSFLGEFIVDNNTSRR